MTSPQQNSLPPARRLTVAIVARHADEHLAATLESVAGLADEILILDAGANRGVSALAERFGAVVFSGAWTDDFSAAYNHLAGQATGHWVLWLEPGERLAAEDCEPLRLFLRQPANFDKAYTLLVIAPAAPGQISREQVAQIRLAPNRSSTRHVGRARPSMRASLEAANIPIEMLPWRIIRGESDSAQAEIERARRELRLIDLEISDVGARRICSWRGPKPWLAWAITAPWPCLPRRVTRPSAVRPLSAKPTMACLPRWATTPRPARRSPKSASKRSPFFRSTPNCSAPWAVICNRKTGSIWPNRRAPPHFNMDASILWRGM